MRSVKHLALMSAMSAALLTSLPGQAAPGLVDIYQMALLHDAQLAQARARYEAEREIMTQARSLLLPKVDARASLQQNESNLDGNSGSDQVLSVNLEQPLFNREAFSRYDQAKYQLESSEITYRLAQQSLIERVSSVYFDVLLAEQNLALATSKQEADKIQWEKAQASSDVGLASRTDVLQTRSAYDLSISARINAENSLDSAYEAMTKLTGKSVNQIKQLVLDVALPNLNMDKTALELKAESDNLQVRLAQQNFLVASEEVEAQKSGHWFNVSLNAQISDSSYSGYGTGSTRRDNQNTSVGITLNVPLYRGGATSSQVSEARFNSQAANISVRDAREQARLDARVQAQNLGRGYSLVLALREAVKSSEAFLEAAEEGYRVGLRNLIDVVTARANLFDAQSNLAEALHNVLLTQLRLQNTLGELNVDHLRQIDQLLSNPA
ncbi:MAG: TolC family outer membrane protein [Thiomicrospira sp.]|uniref:TolC family outer membrane protein n=1 Tax=Thiomicrospira sp. TaxID=935 RepID=UPI0019E29690|nr:TolC family outer membrane protein [Thiomicrospira sp.]MBE0493916.1 TolC family outer membrane protein [Thiomicrospira sp.]